MTLFCMINEMCLLFGMKDRTIKVFEQMTFQEFYNKYHNTIISPTISKKRFLRANRFRRLFSRGVIWPGNRVYIPKY